MKHDVKNRDASLKVRRAVCQVLEQRVLYSTAVSTPFHGTPVVAGTPIEAENYDLGGEGVAYHDTSAANVGKLYRTAEGVDINAGGSNGFNVGSTVAGEWMKYTVNVPATGTYVFSASAGAPTTGAKFHAEIDGANVTGSLAVPNSGDWFKFKTVSSGSFNLTAGAHVMRVVIDANLNGWTAAGNFDLFNLKAQGSTPVPPPVTPPVTPPPTTGKSTPFKGSPIVAGTPIEAENYDLGGEGVAYHDSTKGNATKGYRTDDVDIQAGGSNGWNVGNTLASEWTQYTVSVPTTGVYVFSATAGAPAAGGKIHAEFDGANLTGSLAIPNTGDWLKWQTASSGGFNLIAGTHVMRVVIDSNISGWNAAGNFDVFNLTLKGSTPVTPPPTSTNTPFGGKAALVGQPIQAENYDLGGEGIAYHDTTSGNSGGVYRSDSVDIQTGGSNGYNVGATAAGEWLKYTITVPTSGAYIFSTRAASPGNGGKFHAEFDGANLTGSLAMPNSGDWTMWNTVTSNQFQLSAGTHVMRIVIDSNLSGMSAAGNFDVFNVTPVVAPSSITWTAALASPVKRFEGYARSYNGKLFTFGGYNSLINPYAVNTDASVYTVSNNTWASLGQIPVAPTHAGLAMDSTNGILYFVGGLMGAYPGVATTQVWSYNMNNNTWAQMPSLPIPLAAGDAVLVGNEIHYFAGIGSTSRDLNVNVHYVLTLGDTTWHTAAAFPTARDHVTAVSINGKIYVFGGEIGHDTFHNQQTESDVYDPTTNSWSKIADMPLSKSHTESSTFISGTKVIFAGGQVDNYGATNTIEEYDVATNTWAILGNLPGQLEGTMLQLVGNKMILTNGYDGSVMKTGTWIANWNG